MPRPLFTDGWNSFWHFAFGLMAIRYIIIMPIFIAYQCIDIYEENILIDLSEFFIGFGIGYVLDRSKILRR